jgi:hypothetical protein
MDANFKLKSKNRNIKDKELSSGGSYFVETEAYESYVAGAVEPEEVRSIETSV